MGSCGHWGAPAARPNRGGLSLTLRLTTCLMREEEWRAHSFVRRVQTALRAGTWLACTDARRLGLRALLALLNAAYFVRAGSWEGYAPVIAVNILTCFDSQPAPLCFLAPAALERPAVGMLSLRHLLPSMPGSMRPCQAAAAAHLVMTGDMHVGRQSNHRALEERCGDGGAAGLRLEWLLHFYGPSRGLGAAWGARAQDHVVAAFSVTQ